MKACDFVGCTRRPRTPSAQWCEAHYYQLRRGKSMTPIREKIRPVGPMLGPQPRPVCALDDCDKTAKGRYCSMHQARIDRHGDPDVVIAPRERAIPRGAAHPGWTETPSYDAVHQRLKRLYGKASALTCVCGSPAQQWAYIGPRRPGARLPWGDVTEYQAMCVPCHKAMDLAAIESAS